MPQPEGPTMARKEPASTVEIDRVEGMGDERPAPENLAHPPDGDRRAKCLQSGLGLGPDGRPADRRQAHSGTNWLVWKAVQSLSVSSPRYFSRRSIVRCQSSSAP